MRSCTSAFFALSVAMFATSARAATLESTNIDNWVISAHSNDRTGQFSHCATSVPYRSGILLLFSVNSTFGWSMGLSNTQWRLSPGAEFNFEYFIDRGPTLLARGRAINSQMVVVPLANSNALFEMFRQGHVLTVRSGSANYTFSLRDSSAALAMTLDCTRRYVARYQPPSAPSPWPAQSAATGTPPATGSISPTVDQLREEATAVLANVLSAAGVQDFRVLPREEIPAAFRVPRVDFTYSESVAPRQTQLPLAIQVISYIRLYYDCPLGKAVARSGGRVTCSKFWMTTSSPRRKQVLPRDV
jgi:hypothetical protein